MAGRNYERLSIEAFGNHLLRTDDLDPIYVALVRAHRAEHLHINELYRWILAYVCFYHAGVASWMSQFSGSRFWHEMYRAARNVEPAPVGGRWPRGHERRHFRGKNAEQALDDLTRRYGTDPEDFLKYISRTPRAVRGGELCCDPLSFRIVSERTQEHRGFGPWIGFKVADMVDRVLGIPVTFDDAAVFMFEDPKKAALMLWELREGSKYPSGTRPKQEVILKGVTNHLIEYFQGTFKAPPFADRPVNIQEIETILCKWKSHMNGHYPLFNDIQEIRDGLAPWAEQCSTASNFLSHMPSLPDAY